MMAVIGDRSSENVKGIFGGHKGHIVFPAKCSMSIV
jgi:hypothetical protein